MTHYPAHSRIYNIKADSLDTVNINTSTQHSVINNTINKQNENLNSLTGLLAHYDSDSEHEELNGQAANIDAKVDDFLQEINQIVPNESKKQKDSSAWQECFDESTGYPYYWNIQTNVVTWEMPEEYKNWLSQNTVQESKPPDKVQEPDVEHSKVVINNVKKPVQTKKKVNKIVKNKTRRKSSDSEDEKIVMITSFSEGSSSESETEIKEEPKKVEIKIEQSVIMGPHIEDIPKDSEVPNKKEIIENVKEENIDETIILARLRTQAKVLHELGGELPKSLDKSVIADIPEVLKPQSLALVAGYGEDSDQEEEPTGKSLFPIPTPDNTEIISDSQSTLFPATKPIDIKQFEVANNKVQTYTTKETEAESDSVVDSKVFKRKKRLGIAFDVPKRPKTNNEVLELSGEERKGFGFQTDTNINNENKDNDKMPFLKSGITFVKADTLNPVQNEEKKLNPVESEDKLKDFEEIKEIVSEKVTFLGEGKDPVSAVQVMSIQLQTLELAYKAGGLTQKYLYSWLRETFVDLEKLEQDAAPEGWQCQWDRSNKRYFYRNASSGEWQWEFPVDIVGGGEAMDICTTPPPNEEEQEEESAIEPQPSPPKCSPTPPPPPPPVISHKDKNSVILQTESIQPPIPSVPPPIELVPPPPPTISVTENQPLPPGVDSPDLPFYASKQKDKESSVKSDTKNDNLGLELDSFYSDIALLEATTSSNVEASKSDVENVPSPSGTTENSGNDVAVKKKKKSKSKLGQGINMKKKAVSTLVEKWKKVQNDYL